MKSLFACTLLVGAATASAAEPASLGDAVAQGKFALTARLRYESVNQAGTADARAFTLRTRLGFTTAAWQGFEVMLEGENTAPLGRKDYYDGTGFNTAGRATIADPEITQLNQAWVSFTEGKTKFTVGRQRLVLDNARFVGDVGWRQNMQTFDAAVLQDKSVDQLALTYAYLNRINRVFDNSGTQPDYHSRSHLFNASYAGFKPVTFTGYLHLLDFTNNLAAVRNSSTQTFGLSLTGASPLTTGTKLTYRAEFARQSGYGRSVLSYTADYYLLEAGVSCKTCGLAAGYEVLGSDHNQGFRTPLATLHAMNGWADVFLTTPAAGLNDFYLKATAKLPGGADFAAFYHSFGTDRGPTFLGDEVDLFATYKVNKQFTLGAKYASFRSAQSGAAFASRDKIWLQVEFAY